MRKILLIAIIILFIGNALANSMHAAIDNSSNFNPVIYLWLVYLSSFRVTCSRQ